MKDMDKKTGKRILVPSGLKITIHRELGYGRPTINRALDGSTDTAVQRKIRAWALEHGGAEVEPKKLVQVDGKTWKKVKE